MNDQPRAVADTAEPSSQRFVANVASNLMIVALNLFVGIWFTPYLIGVLGIAVFGVATLALSLSNYMGIFDSALNNAVGRFVAIQLRQREYEKASRTFNSALGLALIISLCVLPVILLVSWFSPQLFDVPAGHENSARWVFGLTMVSYTLILTRSVFSSASFARNRLDLQNSIFATNIIVRVVSTVLLLSLAATPGLIQVGEGLFVGTVVSLLLAILIMLKLTPQLRINLKLFSRNELNLLFGMSSWVFVNQVGSILMLNVDQLIVNTALGAAVQGLYASALQWSLLLRSLARTISTALAPIMVLQFAAGDDHKLRSMSILSVKLLGLLMALPVGLIAGLAHPLLRIWLGPSYETLTPILILMVLPLSVNLAVLPLFSLQVAYNKVKVPGIVSLVVGLLNLLLAIWWVGWGQLGLGVAAASAFSLTVKNGIFTPLYAARFQNLPWYTYFPGLVLSVLSSFLVMGVGLALSGSWEVTGWPSLLTICTAISILYCLAAYNLAFSTEQRATLRRSLMRQVR